MGSERPPRYVNLRAATNAKATVPGNSRRFIGSMRIFVRVVYCSALQAFESLHFYCRPALQLSVGTHDTCAGKMNIGFNFTDIHPPSPLSRVIEPYRPYRRFSYDPATSPNAEGGGCALFLTFYGAWPFFGWGWGRRLFAFGFEG